MDYKKFAGPARLTGLAILIHVGMNILTAVMYDEGETVDDGFTQTFLCMNCMSFLMCLSAIVWFAFALGTKSQQKVLLAEDPSNLRPTTVPLASASQSTVVPSTTGGGPVSYVQEKIVIAKSEGDTAQMVGFLTIAGSVLMFSLMIILGFFWILSGMGSGLGGSGGTCDENCEFWGSAAEFSMWASLLLFLCGVITLARPWSWFRPGEDLHDPVVKVRIGIVSGIAIIAVISYGWPALLVIGIALTVFAAAGRANQ